MIEIKILIIAICAGLFSWGGFNNHNMRRFVLPIVLVGTMLFITHEIWCLMSLCVIGAYCMGYGEKSPLRHVFGDGWGRGVWGLIAATCLSLPLFLTHHLGMTFGSLPLNSEPWPLIFLFVYLALNFTLENALKSMQQIIGDLIIGAGFGTIVLLIR